MWLFGSRDPKGLVYQCAAGVLVMMVLAGETPAQGIDPENRPVADIRIEGLRRVDPQLVYNQIRIRKGDAYDKRIVGEDIVRINHLGKFSRIDARIEPNSDGSIDLIYIVAELELISDVQVVGNDIVPDQQILSVIRMRAGDPVEPFLIDRAKKQIISVYEEKGNFNTSVSIDQAMLSDTGILLFRVVEGPRLRIRAIRFQGNNAFTPKQLRSKIRSKTYIVLLRKGDLSKQRTLEDAATLAKFYQDRGYLDAQVGRVITESADGRDAIVTFTISEGSQYIVSTIVVRDNHVFNDDAVIEAMSLRVGDVFSINRLRKSSRQVTDIYGQLGYIETRVSITPVFADDDPNKVDVLVNITEGKPYFVGTVTIKGNQLTKDHVITQQIRDIKPNRPFVGSGIDKTKKRLNASALFENAQVTVLGDLNDDYRDVLIEVKEKNTGSLGFGAGVSSDSGVIGAFDITQRNFDIADFPETPGEFFTGKAFRGAGQYLRLALQPGIITNRYMINFREPYLLDSNIFFDVKGFFFNRIRRDYDEERLGGTFSVGQRFGDVWTASIPMRSEAIDITDIDTDAPIDVFKVAGNSSISSLGLSLTRSTVDDRLFPTRGSRFNLSVARVGLLGGDYDFSRVTAEIKKFWTIEEDFFERRTVLSSRVKAGYLGGGTTPIFERFYGGGQRTIRGFDFRGIGPRGKFKRKPKSAGDGGDMDDALVTVQGDDPIGGDWMFLFNVEYNMPIYQETLRWVVFVDTGTIRQDFGFKQYRVAIGTGIRLKVPFLGRAPFALDLAIPILKEENDEVRLFSFDLAVPF